MSYTDDAVLAKLSTLQETQDSIVGVAQWIMFHRRHADRTVQIWLSRLKESTSHKRLNLIYLANEVCQQSKARHKEDFLVAFSPVIAEATAVAYKGAPSDLQARLRRVIDVWKDRSVFEAPIQTAIEARVSDIDKARGTGGGSAFGSSGSIFSRGGTSMPAELVPLVAPQQKVAKAVLASRAPIATANQEYEKLMAPGATVPSAPVYAARLNGLLKTLAGAESAVDECLQARRIFLEQLLKILDAAKATAAAEIEQLESFQKRKVEVDDKKRDVEFSIMQGLSDDPAPSTSPDAQIQSGTDQPEVEALTPPAMEPEIAEAMEPIQDFGEATGRTEPEPVMIKSDPEGFPVKREPAARPSMETLDELVSHHRSISTGTNGSSKKRKLDATDDFPDLGKDDGIDADVAEMLRRESGTTSA